MILCQNVEVLEITVDRDRSMSVKRKVRLGDGDISGVREAPLLPPTMIKFERLVLFPLIIMFCFIGGLQSK